MATHDIRIPQLGETVEDATVVAWLKSPGDEIAEQEPLVELTTDKVDTEVPSPVAGRVDALLAEEGETVDVGAVVARIVTDGEPSQASEGDVATPAPQSGSVGAAAGSGNGDRSPQRAGSVGSGHGTVSPTDPRLKELRLSPLVRAMISEHGLDPDELQRFAGDQRVTREVVTAYLQQEPAGTERPAGEPVRATASEAAAPAGRDGEGDYAPFSRIRQRTAEHMVASAQTSAHVATGIEVDFERIASARAAYRAAHDGERRLTWMPFVCWAVVQALGQHPRLNASVEGDGLRIHRQVRLGVAVDLDGEGLVVPVLKEEQQADVPTLGSAVEEVARRARQGQLGADDISGGTFTVTGQGPHGTLFTTPIINQPQVGILSVDGIARRPAVVRDEHGGEGLGIRHTGVLVLSWDHRAVDGIYAASFLANVKRLLEAPEWQSTIAHPRAAS